MKNNKKALLVALLAVSSLASCGNVDGSSSVTTSGSDAIDSSSSTPVEEAKVYTHNTFTTVSPSNWNELTYQDNNDTQIMSYLGSSFFTYDFKFDSDGEIVDGEFEMKYDAATKLEDVTTTYAGNSKYSVPAGATGAYAYKITLREDLKWSDGTPIKAGDFVYTMKEQLDPLSQHYRADSFYNSSLVIHNAKDYVKQGQVFDEVQTSSIFSGVAAAKKAGCKVYLDYNTVNATFDDWFGGTYEQVKAAGFFATYFTIYDASGNATSENFFDKYAFTEDVSRIEVTDEMMADYAACLDWDPNADAEVATLSIVDHYETAAVDFANVGIFVGNTDYEIVLVLDKPLELLKEDGSLSYQAAYNLSSLPLVKKDLFEANKVAPSEGSSLWTSTYNTSVNSTASWGPYKLTSFQAGKEYILERNDNWYGYSTELYDGQYQTTRIVCETIAEYETAFMKFLKGEIDGIGIDVSKAQDYKGSDRAIYTPDDYVGSMQLQSSKEALKTRETEGVNKTILSYVDFRKALSLSINRTEYAQACTTSSLAGYGLFNSMHYYDVENGGVFRNTDPARQVLCDTYGVDASEYPSLEKAEKAITGYDLEQARALVVKAYNEALAAGDIKETDKVVLDFGTAAITEAFSRHVAYIRKSFETLVVGTPLEGRIEVKEKEFGKQWAEDFRSGAYDICLGGWSGAAWDPGYFLLAYLSPAYMYSKAWDTSAQMMTMTVEGVEYTYSLIEWYNALNGIDLYYEDGSAKHPNWSNGAVDNSVRLQIIAALEGQVLTEYYTVPLYNAFSSELLSYKVEYATTTYNTFMGYGGIRYLTYNYSDAEWAAYLANHSLDYKG
ncbi:MAG: ABC transporter substrate-binding protein [Erysipelotrichaceae bacterium]|nr:ABC transporter substrate-binding protein [Erysipelotrichaceae bacterium]